MTDDLYDDDRDDGTLPPKLVLIGALGVLGAAVIMLAVARTRVPRPTPAPAAPGTPPMFGDGTPWDESLAHFAAAMELRWATVLDRLDKLEAHAALNDSTPAPPQVAAVSLPDLIDPDTIAPAEVSMR